MHFKDMIILFETFLPLLLIFFLINHIVGRPKVNRNYSVDSKSAMLNYPVANGDGIVDLLGLSFKFFPLLLRRRIEIWVGT